MQINVISMECCAPVVRSYMRYMLMPYTPEALTDAPHRDDTSANGINSWRVMRFVLRVRTFACLVLRQAAILDLSSSLVLRSEPTAGAF
ncbi:hypothetical protein [Bradyrhizobium vignae]|uniref:Uncharacterized protein n=1 Tax=Bradyrhizobium vignae TaxID=1549949 RepID=A0A2U3PUP2_9BRAD|nr:hypothetical protein [Bradyrhizobium vignae]SPP92862.1 protein of unknown function [Bradyrhizobium vignae]